MAGCEEWTNLEEVPPMDVREASKKRPVRAREFVKSWFVEQGLAKDEQETSIDFGKRLSSEFMMPLKEKVDKARLVAVEASGGDKRRLSIIPKGAPVETGKAIDKIQMEKIDKTVVEVLDGEKNRFSTIASGAPVETAVDNMQTEKMDECAESDHVCLVLDMPRETPIDDDTEDFSFITNLAKRLNHSEDWIEERKQQYRERAAVSKRIRDHFFDWINNGCLEEEEDDDDDEHEANYARVMELNNRLWDEHCDFSGLREEDSMLALA